jgi:hypothetical protein
VAVLHQVDHNKVEVVVVDVDAVVAMGVVLHYHNNQQPSLEAIAAPNFQAASLAVVTGLW